MEEQTNTTEQAPNTDAVVAAQAETEEKPVAEVPDANPPETSVSIDLIGAGDIPIGHRFSTRDGESTIHSLFPVLGSIVVYTGLHQAEAHAAIVTHVYDSGTVDLFVFEKYPGNGVARTKVPYSVEIANHTYRWPFEYQPSGLR